MSEKLVVKTLEELKKDLPVCSNPIEVHVDKLTRMEKVALWITQHTGSMGFFIICAIWTVGWLGWNLLAPANMRFDQVPAFVLWLFMANVLQLLLTPLIMVGQNVQSRQTEIKIAEDLNLDRKAEIHMQAILTHLENQNQDIEELKKLIIDSSTK
jgi:uncharacterized membrane protein